MGSLAAIANARRQRGQSPCAAPLLKLPPHFGHWCVALISFFFGNRCSESAGQPLPLLKRSLRKVTTLLQLSSGVAAPATRPPGDQRAESKAFLRKKGIRGETVASFGAKQLKGYPIHPLEAVGPERLRLDAAKFVVADPRILNSRELSGGAGRSRETHVECRDMVLQNRGRGACE